ncbi:MAG: GTP cyclohydrolase MptA [Promethearchaeota archaeon]
MKFKRDIQSEEILNGIKINKVGITNVLRKIDIHKGSYYISINAKINAFISLPGDQRGIHMSRTAESIEYVINNASIQPVENVETFCIRIIDSLLKDHPYSSSAEVEMTGDLFILVKSSERDQTQRAYEMYSKVIAEKNKDNTIQKNVLVGISAMGITACPCAQDMSREYAKEIISSRKDLEISEEKLDKILNIIPIASHNQRAKGQIIIGGKKGDRELVDVLDLIEVIENSMSAHIRTILKRPDEAELVRIAHLNPMFVEDVVRNMAKKMAGSKFAQIPGECTAKISADSLESIHYHNAYAEVNTTLGEIRAKFK